MTRIPAELNNLGASEATISSHVECGKRVPMLAQSEQTVRKAIQESDVPFLGLLGETFTPELKFSIEIAVLANPSVQGYVKYLRQYPALFSVNLTSHIMEGMGQAGHFELYSHVQRAIGTNRELSSFERESLWDAFRQAILTLGFEPSPRISGQHFMADEYLRQVGVPLAFVDDLAERMLTFAKRVGIPDEDDPDSLTRWQIALDAKLEQPFSRTARKAVLMDSQGYYTRVFVRLHSNGGHFVSTTNALEKAMARAFTKQPGVSYFKRAILPYLSFHDGTLGMFIPGGDEREFNLRVDGTCHPFQAGIEEKFVPINEALPREILIEEVNGHQSTQCILWEDQKPNRLLIFSDTGRFKESAQLNQSTALVIPPGNYTFLSRFCPSEVDADKLCDDPQLYTFPMLIHPGQKTILQNGPARLVVQGESQPFAHWEGQSKATKEGVEFFFGVLNLVIEFPKEWLTISGKNYLLRLSINGIDEQLALKLILDESGKVVINVYEEAHQRNWKAGFGRLLVEVYRIGENRSLLRSSVLYWYGMMTVSKALTFECGKLPCNLLQSLSENICVTATAIKPKASLSKTLRITFQLDSRRNQSLTWNVPGVFVEIEIPSESGRIQRHSRPLGSVEVISYTSSKQILISASDSGEIRFGDWSQRVDFGRAQIKRLSAAFLTSHVTSQSNCLIYCNEQSGVELTLLKLVQPHYVQSISSKISARQLIVRFAVPKALDAVLVHAQDIVSGEDMEISIEANTGKYTTHRFGQAQFMCLKDDAEGYIAYVYLDLEIWPSGAWVFRFDGRVNNIWGHLENERQDQFAIGLLSNDEGMAVDVKQFLSCLSELTDKQSLSMLSRVYKAMLPCYARDSWSSLQWLLDTWKYLLSRWKGKESEIINVLMELIECAPPADSSPSWMLQMTLGSSLPSIFCLPAQSYLTVADAKHPLVQAVKVLAAVQENYPAVFPHLLHSAAAAGFPNFSEVARGGRPKGFSIDQYSKALRELGAAENMFRIHEDDFTPVLGDYLGPLHYKHAVRQLKNSYERSLDGNEIRRGQAIGLCNYVRRQMPQLTADDSPRLAGCPPHVEPWKTEDDSAITPEAAQQNQNLENFSHALSWFAYHCRLEAKSPGQLEVFIKKLNESGIPVQSSLAYLLQVGDALFAYYLVFWELVITAEHIAG